MSENIKSDALPRGRKEFDAWSDEIIALAGAPNNDSTKFALATMIMHLQPTEAFKSKDYFVDSLLKGISNEVAYAVMHELKEKQKAAIEAEKQAALEAPQASAPEASSEPQPSVH